MDRTKIVDRDTLETKTAALDGWELGDAKITRTWEFADFLTAVSFIEKMAPHAEELDHHPELFNVYNKIEVTLNTHDAGGLTEYDFALAARLDAVAASLPHQ